MLLHSFLWKTVWILSIRTKAKGSCREAARCGGWLWWPGWLYSTGHDQRGQTVVWLCPSIGLSWLGPGAQGPCSPLVVVCKVPWFLWTWVPRVQEVASAGLAWSPHHVHSLWANNMRRIESYCCWNSILPSFCDNWWLLPATLTPDDRSSMGLDLNPLLAWVDLYSEFPLQFTLLLDLSCWFLLFT